MERALLFNIECLWSLRLSIQCRCGSHCPEEGCVSNIGYLKVNFPFMPRWIAISCSWYGACMSVDTWQWLHLLNMSNYLRNIISVSHDNFTSAYNWWNWVLNLNCLLSTHRLKPAFVFHNILHRITLSMQQDFHLWGFEKCLWVCWTSVSHDRLRFSRTSELCMQLQKFSAFVGLSSLDFLRILRFWEPTGFTFCRYILLGFLLDISSSFTYASLLLVFNCCGLFQGPQGCLAGRKDVFSHYPISSMDTSHPLILLDKTEKL